MGKAAEAREARAPRPPPGGAAAAGRVAHGLARASSTDLRTPLHALQRRACSRSPCGPGSSAAGTAELSRATWRGGRPHSPAARAPAGAAKSSRDGRKVAKEALPGATARGRRGSGGGGGRAGTVPRLLGRVPTSYSSRGRRCTRRRSARRHLRDPGRAGGRAAECIHFFLK